MEDILSCDMDNIIISMLAYPKHAPYEIPTSNGSLISEKNVVAIQKALPWANHDLYWPKLLKFN